MAENKELSIEELKAQLAEAQKENAQAKKVIAEQNELIEKTSGELKTAEANAKFPVITVDKKKFKVAVKSIAYKDKVYSLEELKEDKELQKELIEIGSGALIEIK